MINTKFEAYKLKRELKRSGIKLSFYRYGTNKFGEKNLEPEKIGELKCLYHEQNNNIQITGTDATRIRTEKIPMLLCLHDDLKLLNLEVDDFVFINNKRMKMTGIVDVQEWNIICDISLELVDNGSN